MKNEKIVSKGMTFAFYTALVSGFSVFLNSLAVKAVPNSYFFTTAKNTVVAILLITFIIGIKKRNELKKLKRKDWSKLAFVGLIGGSIPFLLFFKGMSMSAQAAVNGAFIHKMLFIWVAVLAFVFLKEKLSILQYLALGVMMVGIYLAGGPKNMHFGYPELLIFIATLMWSFEAVIVKKFVKGFDSQIMALGRMFFGAVIMIVYLLGTNNYATVFKMDGVQVSWVVITSALLFLYVNFYYMALKAEKASVVASILTVAFPITVMIQNYNQGVSVLKPVGVYIPLLVGILVVLLAPNLIQIFQKKLTVSR